MEHPRESFEPAKKRGGPAPKLVKPDSKKHEPLERKDNGVVFIGDFQYGPSDIGKASVKSDNIVQLPMFNPIEFENFQSRMYILFVVTSFIYD